MCVRVFMIFTALLVHSICVYAEEITYQAGRNVQVVFKVEDFKSNEHRINYIEDSRSSSPIISSIDGRIPFGIKPILVPDGMFARIELWVGDKRYELDSSGMYDPNVKFLRDGLSDDYIYVHCYGEINCIVRMILSDAATAYVAEWSIKYGVSQRTILTSEDDIVGKFIRRIAPPIFIDE